MTTPIFVTGATGTIGTFLLAELRRLGVPARALVRTQEQATRLANDAVECVVGDLTDTTSLTGVLQGVERAFLLTPGMPFHPQAVDMARHFVAAAAATAVRHVVVQSIYGISADADKPRILQDHAAIRALLESSGIPFTLLRTNYGMQSLAGQGMLASAKHQGAIYHSLGETGVAYVDLRDVAAVAARCLTTEGHAGRAYRLCGPQVLKSSELAAVLADVFGKPVVAHVPSPEQVADKMRSFGMSEAIIAHGAALGAFNATGALGHLSDDVSEVLGRSPTSFRTFAGEHPTP